MFGFMLRNLFFFVFFISFFNLYGECKNLDKDNYNYVFKQRVSGYYKNPLDNNCVLISFYENDKSFIQLDLSNSFFFIKDGLNVVHKDGEVFLKFNKDGDYYRFVKKTFNVYTSEIRKFYKDFIIIHEMFHFSKIKIKKNYYKEEVFSDLMTLSFLYNSGKIRKEELLKSIKEIKLLRTNSFNMNFNKSKENRFYDIFYKKVFNNEYKRIDDYSFLKIKNDMIKLLEY